MSLRANRLVKLLFRAYFSPVVTDFRRHLVAQHLPDGFGAPPVDALGLELDRQQS